MWGDNPTQKEQSMKFRAIGRIFLGSIGFVALTACTDGFDPFSRDAASDTSVATQKSVRLIDRDVEAPAVFEAEEQALWDGRPSLGGVWVASPDAVDPERVIMRNPANGKFVIGALFRRERDNPGPNLQISSDAAAALGLVAGQPAVVSVTALRREEAKATVNANQPILDTAETVQTETPVAPADSAAVETVAQSPLAPPVATGNGRLIQIGIFAIEANANRAAATLSAAGVPASIRASTSQGKPLWSVTARGDTQSLDIVRAAGFGDAYFVKG
jgi:cell division septation protein DedD